MNDSKTNIKKSSTWIRLIYIVLFGAILIPAGRFVLALITLGQFLMVLITGSDNHNMRNLGKGIGQWVYQGILFLTFNTDAKPFPFDDWPEVEQSSEGLDESNTSDVEDKVAAEDDSDIPTFLEGEDSQNDSFDTSKNKK
jgi:hypothetical protein